MPHFSIFYWTLREIETATSMLVADVGDGFCWWHFWDVDDRCLTLKSLQHNESATNIISYIYKLYDNSKSMRRLATERWSPQIYQTFGEWIWIHETSQKIIMIPVKKFLIGNLSVLCHMKFSFTPRHMMKIGSGFKYRDAEDGSHEDAKWS